MLVISGGAHGVDRGRPCHVSRDVLTVLISELWGSPSTPSKATPTPPSSTHSPFMLLRLPHVLHRKQRLRDIMRAVNRIAK